MLARATQRSGKPSAEFSILIKPDLDCLAGDRPTWTDPGLVEHLIDLLHERGWPRVSLGVLPDPIFRPIQNRDPLTLADLAGYRFLTPEGHAYAVEDLASNWTPIDPDAEFSDRSPRVAAAWLDADFRICLPRFRTDPDLGYRLALSSLVHLLTFDPVEPGASLVEARDKIVCVLRRIPPQFVILDALSSCLGADGMLRPVTSPTTTIIAGEAPLLVDWVAASKAGLPATVSPLMRTAQRARVPRGPLTIVGDIRPFAVPPVEGRPAASELPVYEQRFALLAHLLASELDFDLFPPEGLVLTDLAGRLRRLTPPVPAPALVVTLQAIGRYCDRRAIPLRAVPRPESADPPPLRVERAGRRYRRADVQGPEGAARRHSTAGCGRSRRTPRSNNWRRRRTAISSPSIPGTSRSTTMTFSSSSTSRAR